MTKSAFAQEPPAAASPASEAKAGSGHEDDSDILCARLDGCNDCRSYSADHRMCRRPSFLNMWADKDSSVSVWSTKEASCQAF